MICAAPVAVGVPQLLPQLLLQPPQLAQPHACIAGPQSVQAALSCHALLMQYSPVPERPHGHRLHIGGIVRAAKLLSVMPGCNQASGATDGMTARGRTGLPRHCCLLPRSLQRHCLVVAPAHPQHGRSNRASEQLTSNHMVLCFCCDSPPRLEGHAQAAAALCVAAGSTPAPQIAVPHLGAAASVINSSGVTSEWPLVSASVGQTGNHRGHKPRSPCQVFERQLDGSIYLLSNSPRAWTLLALPSSLPAWQHLIMPYVTGKRHRICMLVAAHELCADTLDVHASSGRLQRAVEQECPTEALPSWQYPVINQRVC